MSSEIKSGLEQLRTKVFEQSDYFIGRNISCLIKLSWSEDEVRDRATGMVKAIKSSIK